MKKLLLSVFGLLALTAGAQEKCSAHSLHEQKLMEDPSLVVKQQQLEDFTANWIQSHPVIGKERNAIYRIPVVVHVVYNTAGQNISDAQIQSQIDILNDDFQLMNADSLQPSHPFWAYTANTQIEFCLASQDPNGNYTTGVTRTQTSVSSFNGDGSVKFSAYGGVDNWDPTKYLNLWVCDLGASGGTLGYASFPSDLSTYPAEDGVVIHHQAFGDIGTAGDGGFAANDLGRTATHEVGHWLNLFHIWGDNQPNCGDDLVADTEPCDEPNYGIPSFPLDANNPCGTGADGEMFMNYMDYVDDQAMVMFTFGQSSRMHAAINGPRSGLLTTTGCDAPLSVDEQIFAESFEVYPNPSSGSFTVQFQKNLPKGSEILVYNLVGELVKTISLTNELKHTLDLTDLADGVYYANLKSDKVVKSKKIIIAR